MESQLDFPNPTELSSAQSRSALVCWTVWMFPDRSFNGSLLSVWSVEGRGSFLLPLNGRENKANILQLLWSRGGCVGELLLHIQHSDPQWKNSAVHIPLKGEVLEKHSRLDFFGTVLGTILTHAFPEWLKTPLWMAYSFHILKTESELYKSISVSVTIYWYYKFYILLLLTVPYIKLQIFQQRLPKQGLLVT